MKLKLLSLPVAALSLGLIASNPVHAQVVNNLAQVNSGSYDIEPAHTQVSFSVLHFGFTNYQGMFSRVSGTMKLDAKHPAKSQLEVKIPVDSVQTTSSKLNDELKSAQWFDAAKFPDATFKSTAIHMVNANNAIVNGDFTLHGIKKPISLKVHFIGAGVNSLDKKYTTGFEATGTIKRSDFDVKMYVPYVSDAVQLHISGAFEQQG